MREFPPEIELLLCSAAPQSKVSRAPRIRELVALPLNWTEVLVMANAQGVAPLLYWTLNATCPEVVPPELARTFQSNTHNSVRLTAELLRVVALLSAAGIPVLPFKGPTLAIAAFGNVALRQFVDLDILVPRKDALRARELLMSDGYTLNLQLPPAREQEYLAAYDEFVLYKKIGGLMLELHWGITRPYFSVPLDIADLFARVSSVRIGQRDLPSLSTEDLVTVLCIHGTKHCWSHLSLVADLAWLLTACQVHWSEVLDRVRVIHALRMTLLGFRLVDDLFGFPFPPEIREAIQADRSLDPLASAVIDSLFRGVHGEGEIARSAAFHLKSRERWRDRALYLSRLITTRSIEDWQAANLPSPLSFLYPLVRFPRLLRKYSKRIP